MLEENENMIGEKFHTNILNTLATEEIEKRLLPGSGETDSSDQYHSHKFLFRCCICDIN